MAYNKTQTFDNNPNTSDVFAAFRSDNQSYFASIAAHGGGEMGVGSFKDRSVSAAMVTYRPFETSINTMIMLTGGKETATNVVHEWAEDDELLPDQAVSVTPVSSNSTYLTDSSYASASSGRKITVSESDAGIFKKNFIIRYATDGNSWELAMITDVAAPASSKVDLTLSSLDGSNLAKAAAVGGKIQFIASNNPADGEPEVTPRGSTPKMYYTYLQKLKAEAKFTEREENEDLLIDEAGGLARAMRTAYRDMNYQLEKLSLYGKRGLISGTDKFYSTPGLYDEAKASNYHTSDFKTSGVFDATKFKNAIAEFIQWNFGAESGGSPRRQGFIDGTFASYLSRAYEDKIQLQGIEYIGGLRAMQWVDNNGIIDFIKAPIFEVAHPIVGGSLRDGGTPRAVCLLVDVPNQVVRVEMKGEGLREDIFKEQNQNESQVYRVRYTCGMYLRLKKYSAVLEEVIA